MVGKLKVKLNRDYTTNKSVSSLFDLYSNSALGSDNGNTFEYGDTPLEDLLLKEGPERIRNKKLASIGAYFANANCGVDPRDDSIKGSKNKKICINTEEKLISSSIKFVVRLGFTDKSDANLPVNEKRVLLETEEKLAYLAAPLKAFASLNGGLLMESKDKTKFRTTPKKSPPKKSPGKAPPTKSPSRAKQAQEAP